MLSTKEKTPLMLIVDKKTKMRFEMQPIMRLEDQHVIGYELLYRGPRSPNWTSIDRTLFRYLATNTLSCGAIYVNIAPESFPFLSDEDFVAAAARNKVVFEICESVPDPDALKLINTRVHKLSHQGLTFAIDDFGAGVNVLHRVFTLEMVSIIKIDGALLEVAFQKRMARRILKTMIREWKKHGITTVAEWVSSPELMTFSQDAGIALAQGWYIDELAQAQREATTPQIITEV